ncbi:MAG: hypothetical protein PUB52_09740 [Lachnospiraceae bacterium]|nr:hypothetical protein [Lachnospiraceae bacterium]
MGVNFWMVCGLAWCGLCLLLKLNVYAVPVCGAIVLTTGILYTRGRRREREQKKRFYDVTGYLDTMLLAFSRGGKIHEALEAAETVIQPGTMRDVIRQTRIRMAVGLEDREIYREGLALIEEAFPCDPIRKVHGFMIHAEYYGGETARSIELLQLERKHWQDRCQANMEERRRSFRNIVLSAAMSLVICGMILYLPTANVDISTHPAVQIVGVLAVAINAMILLLGQRYLAVDWIRLGEEKKVVDYAQKLEDFRGDDSRRGKVPRIVLSVLSVALALFFVLRNQPGMGMLMLALALFGRNWRGIVRDTQRKQLTRQLRRDFPRWLLDIALLLQSENVQMALRKSAEQAPDILRGELQLLLARLDMEPESFEPYHGFFQEFDIPEIHSSMSGLYAISMGNEGRQGQQLQELVSGNHELLDVAERERQKDENSGMYLLFLAPVLTASGKMVVDMAVFMMTFLSGVTLGP